MTRHDQWTLRDCDNQLLNRLRPAEIELLSPLAEVWTAGEQDVLFEPGDPVDYTFFPCGQSLASFRVVFPDGRSVETGLVGREGAVGGIVSQGRLPAFARSVVQFPGMLVKIRTSRLEQAKKSSEFVSHLFARYAD